MTSAAAAGRVQSSADSGGGGGGGGGDVARPVCYREGVDRHIVIADIPPDVHGCACSAARGLICCQAQCACCCGTWCTDLYAGKGIWHTAQGVIDALALLCSLAQGIVIP